METSEKKRFQKQKLNSEDYKGMELAAKALRSVLGAATAVAVFVANKQNLKTLGKNMIDVVGQIKK